MTLRVYTVDQGAIQSEQSERDPRMARMTRLEASCILLLICASGCDQSSSTGRRSTPKSSLEASTRAWVCPMHPEVRSEREGPCTVCGMKLVLGHGGGAFLCPDHALSNGAADLSPGKCRTCGKELQGTKAVLVYDCPQHKSLSAPEGGSCPICGKTLLPRTMALLWKCIEHSHFARVTEGSCALCSRPLAKTFVQLPHGDHNPKHGGIFFMAPDLWHHIEGTLPQEGLFRLYLYDNFTRPLDSGGAKAYLQVSAGTGGDLHSLKIPLLAAAAGECLEAGLKEAKLPLELALFLSFDPSEVGPQKPSSEPFRFDFRFERVSSPSAEDQAPAERQSAPQPEIPKDPLEIDAEIDRRAERVRGLIGERALTALYVPALEAKDLALALLERTKTMAPESRAALERAAASIVRGAWLLDLHGDMGDLRKVEEDHKAFREGVEEIHRLIRKAGNTSR